METLIDRIDYLKTCVMLAADLTIPLVRYQDLLEEEEFLDLGTPGQPEELMEICKLAVAVAYSKKPQIILSRIIHIKECHFYHGTAIVNGEIALVFYFADIRRGLLIVLRPGDTKILRISSTAPAQGPFISRPAKPATD